MSRAGFPGPEEDTADMDHYQGQYSGENLSRVAFPLGGIGSGMICLEGAGTLSHVSLRHRPEVFHEPMIFGALHVKGDMPVTRVLEGPVPARKVFGLPQTGKGSPGKHYGLPRFRDAAFKVRFPFATVTLTDERVPLSVSLTGWSPFVLGDAAASGLPAAVLEYRFANPTGQPIDAVFSFHARNFMATETPGAGVRPVDGGFCVHQLGSDETPWDEGAFAVAVLDDDVNVDCAWFRSGWFDAVTMLWNTIAAGRTPQRAPHAEGKPGDGGSVYKAFQLAPGQEKVVRVLLAWYVPRSNLTVGHECDANEGESCACDKVTSQPARKYHAPWYATQYDGIDAVVEHWAGNYQALRQRTETFTDCFYDTTLPAEVISAIAANLSILKSPTVLRQADGRLWCWEGCCDGDGCCPGSCTHVWNYAQALPHLFADLERSLRQTEFNENQDDRGHQMFRSALPIGPVAHDFYAAADGQLGGIMKVYRDWRISGDTRWLETLWPKVEQSLDYCIETWDPAHKGILEEPHHNTYDIEFWGPDGMCTSIYLGALAAACAMAEALGRNADTYRQLYERGRAYLEGELFNGEYFFQQVRWQDLKSPDPTRVELKKGREEYSAESVQLLAKEGPKYQYGTGCLADGVLGGFLAMACGLSDILDSEKVASHLAAVHRHNLKSDLSEHANPQRPGYALGNEGGLLLCTWPRGGKPSLPFVYSEEVFTGVEYQVAAHLMHAGMVEQGLQIVRACRDRYDGRVRNPFNEYECGHWYARALSSYAMIQGLTGLRYDAVEKVLYIAPNIKGDFRAFLSTATGFGTAGVRDGEPFVEVRAGAIDIERIEYRQEGT